jgi:hypothetical protein
VSRALLVPHQHVMDLAVLQGIVGGQDSTAGISEDVRHAFLFQTVPQNLRSSFHHGIIFL